MLRDVIDFGDFQRNLRAGETRTKAVDSTVKFLEKRLGGEFVYDIEQLPYPYPDLADLFRLAEHMGEREIIINYGPIPSMSDEPRVAHWQATCGNQARNPTSGSSAFSERDALVKTLAEANERYLWYERTDFGLPLVVESEKGMSGKDHPALGSFAGFNEADRTAHKRLHISPDTRFAWIRGYSWTKGRPIWIPFQTISGYSGTIADHALLNEPMIRPMITNGLASNTTQKMAVLSGALELIERDAHIVTWLNQISAPRLNTDVLAAENTALQKIVEACRRYRMEPHFVRLLTDAPAYAICAVLEDTSGIAPHYAFGLKANRDPAKAALGAVLEAMRAHRGIRGGWVRPEFDPLKPVAKIGHVERLQYWAHADNYKKLDFFIAGKLQNRVREPFESDTDEAHLERIFAWCRSKDYELASVSFTRSKANLTPWHIESCVMPELQPSHLIERFPTAHGPRVSEVPVALGYVPRKEPFLDAPHPFA